MIFKDRNEEKEGFLDKCRKRMKQVARVAMAVAVGGCLWGQGEMGLAATSETVIGDFYSFSNPASNNVIVFDENGNLQSSTSTSDKTITSGGALSVSAGYDLKGEGASNNQLIINGGDWRSISGGSSTGSADNNIITFNGGNALWIYGGVGETATGNTVNMEGGTVRIIESNIVNMDNGSAFHITSETSNIKGGTITGSIAAKDSINIYSHPDLSKAQLTTTNLNIHTKQLTADNIGPFSNNDLNINFYLPSDIQNGDTVLTLTNSYGTYLSNTNTKISAGVEGNANISNGDIITLIKNENGIYTDETTTYGKLTEGVSMDYDLTVEKADDTSIVARVGSGSNNSSGNNGSSSLPSLNPQTNFLPKPLLSTSTLALQGTDRLLDWLPPEDFSVGDEKSGTQEEKAEENTGTAASDGGGQIIANAGVSSMRIKTGANSYMNNHSGGFDVGMARTIRNRHGRLIFAPIVDYGSGTYDAYTDDGRKMHGWGSTKYWAGGMIARQINDNGIYYEGSFRAGRTTLDFSSDDFLVQGNPTYEHYDTSAPFFAGHLRVGRVYQIARNNQLHLYGIYSHTHQNGMTAHLSTGETYNFSAVDSGRLRIGARLSWQKKKNQRFYSGLAYQYEYATGVSGTYRGRSTDSSGIHGSSVMLELGWQVKPSERSSWMVDVGAVGWVGHQKGVAFQVQMKKAF